MLSSHQDKFQAAAKLVKTIGTIKLDNGETVTEFLSVDGVFLWNAITPVLAAFNLPSAAYLHPSFNSRAKLYARAYLAETKYRLIIQKKIIEARRNAQKKESGQIDIGFIVNSGYMFRDVIEPLVDFCVKSGKKILVVQDGDMLNTINPYPHYNFYSLWQDWGHQEDGDLNRVKKIFKNKVTYLEKSKLFRAALHGQSYIKPEYLELVIPMLLYYLIASKKILSKLDFHNIVSPDVADSRSRVFGLIAQTKDIPWMDIQFGVYGKEAVEWCFVASDKVAVWGKTSRDLFVNLGVEPKKLLITGSPRFDYLERYQSHVQSAVPLRVLFASMYSLVSYGDIGDFKLILKNIKHSIFRIAKNIKDVELIVKLHPIEDEQSTRSIVSESASITWVNGKSDIRDQIRYCDVFITLGSTSTMDALKAGKIVIYPAYDGLVWWDDIYINAGVVFVVKNESELINLISEICNGGAEKLMKGMEAKRQCFLAENIYTQDGNASRRILDHLHRIN